MAAEISKRLASLWRSYLPGRENSIFVPTQFKRKIAVCSYTIQEINLLIQLWAELDKTLYRATVNTCCKPATIGSLLQNSLYDLLLDLLHFNDIIHLLQDFLFGLFWVAFPLCIYFHGHTSRYKHMQMN